MTTAWINDALRALPGTDDALFQKLWKEQRLLFDGLHGVADTVDECSARLVAAALRRGSRLLITLPDFQPHRAAFLFATALIRHLLDSRQSGHTGISRDHRVLYFGGTVGIRDHLTRISVRGLRLTLAEVFRQRDLARGAAALDGNARAEALPPVVTVYAPADPAAVLRSTKPSWISVDCGDASSMAWLRPLLDEAAQRGIPVVAWGQNPLSDCVRDFTASGLTFTWPARIQPPGFSLCRLSGDPATLLQANDTSRLLPLVLNGEAVESFSKELRDAGQALGRITQQIGGRFAKDSVAVHWKYLRALETLAVPMDFYEAEAPRFWGLKSLAQLSGACDHFRNACAQIEPGLYRELENVANLLHEAKTHLQSEGCALWETLSYTWMEDTEGNEARILVFPSDSRKRLFLYAMLARHNVTEDDLRDNGTHVASLNDMRNWMHVRHRSSEIRNGAEDSMPSENLIWHPILVGLPSPAVIPKLLSALMHPKMDIVLYPHQCPSLMRRQDEWRARLSGDSGRNVKALTGMSGMAVPCDQPTAPARITMDAPIEVNVKTISRTKSSTTGVIWQPEDAVSEVARLFQTDDESAAEEVVLNEQPDAVATTAPETSGEIWCAEAIKVQFDHGWHVHFAPDDKINVVQDGRLDLRYVRALRVGERVLLIHGQQRQNLYDLIISRVHRHPSIELHLAMIRRWQEDLRVAYQRWQAHAPDTAERLKHGPRDVEGLLRRMQALGCERVSTLTLSFWLRGDILCPLDPNDLRRVAEVLDMGFVRQYHGRIVQAAERLRGLHRGLSIKLNHWLEAQATGTIHRSDDDVIDADLGLTFGDMRNSLLVLRILGIQNVPGPFLRSNLSRAEKD